MFASDSIHIFRCAGVVGVGPTLVSMARQRNQFLFNLMNTTVLARMDELMNQILPMEFDILTNKPHSNLTMALLWLDLNDNYAKIFNDLANSTQQEIFRFLDDQASQNSKWFVGVLVVCIVTVLGCPTVLFWYALKSERLMRKVARFNREIKRKVQNHVYQKSINDKNATLHGKFRAWMNCSGVFIHFFLTKSFH